MKWLVKVESTSGEDNVKIIKITTKGLEYHINIVDEAIAKFRKTAYNFERSPIVDEMLSSSIAFYREIVKGRVD